MQSPPSVSADAVLSGRIGPVLSVLIPVAVYRFSVGAVITTQYAPYWLLPSK